MTPDLFLSQPAPATVAVTPPAMPSEPTPVAPEIGPDGLALCPHFTLEEHPSASYAPRTHANAAADATWAYAVDFTTAGEVLTAKAAGDRILQTKVGTPAEECSKQLVAHLRKLKARSLNIAGNGLYTLITNFPGKPEQLQQKLDAFVLKVLTAVHTEYPLQQIRSGGQTGVDEAGAKAGIALGVPTLVLMPKGYRIRNAMASDYSMTRGGAWRRFVPSPPNPSLF